MPRRLFKGRDGKFTSGVLISRGDILNACRREGTHILPPPPGSRPWGSQTGSWRVGSAEVQGLPPLSQKKITVRKALYILERDEVPPERIIPFCGNKHCINPQHMRIEMPLDTDAFEKFFRLAMPQAKQGKPLEIKLPNEGDAIRWRHALNTYRRKEIDEGRMDPEMKNLVLRIREDESGKFILFGDLPEQSFSDLLSSALEENQITETSALDLILEEKTDD